jgi:mRNA-degrading endonuclease toxin of MazEF toxin-antitoxin module
MYSPVVTVIPLTTSVKRPYPQQVPLVLNGGISIALADQMTSVPVSELNKYMCTLHDFQMEQINRAIEVQLGFVDTGNSVPYLGG